MSEKCNICDIVLELLPLYIESRTGEESKVYVERHLSECEVCREAYLLMSAELLTQEEIEDKKGQKNRKKSRSKSFVRIAKKVVLILAGLSVYIWLMVQLLVFVFRYLTGV